MYAKNQRSTEIMLDKKNEYKLTLPAIIWLFSTIVATGSYFANVDLGWIGWIFWGVFLLGILYFVALLAGGINRLL
jgi:hypothetical protein